MSEVDILKTIKDVEKEKKPFGLGGKHNLKNSGRMLCGQIKKVAGATGLDMAECSNLLKSVADKVSQPKKRKGPLQDVPGQAAIADEAEGQPASGDTPAFGDGQPNVTAAEAVAPEPYRRKSVDQPLLSELVLVVEHALSLPEKSPREKVCREKFPNILRSNVLSKWINKYFKFQLWKMPSLVQQKLRGVPNWWVEELGLPLPKRARSTIVGVPREVAKTVFQAQLQVCVGNTAATKRADASQGPQMLRRSLQKAISKYNADVEAAQEVVESQNAAAWKDFQTLVEGCADDNIRARKRKLSTGFNELKTKVQKVPKKCQFKPNMMTASRFQKAHRLVSRSTNTTGNFLSYGDPRMEAARQKVKELVLQNNIHPGLALCLGKKKRSAIVSWCLYIYICIKYI